MTWQEELFLDLVPPTELFVGLKNERTSFFVTNGKCYIMDGTNYLVYDGETINEIVPYVPTLAIGKVPEGGGDAYEDFNLLGSGFKDSFSTLGTDTVFHLTLKGLDTTLLSAEVNGKTMKEGEGFTVDRVNGKVTFTSAPAKGTNNVIITAYKTFAAQFKNYFNGDAVNKEYQLSQKEIDNTPVTASIDAGTTFNQIEGTHFTVDRKTGKVTFVTAPSVGTNNVVIQATSQKNDFPNRIKKCTFHTMFGGSNDTRVFLSGNPDMPDYVFRLGLYDPTYAPENGFYKYPDKVTGFSKQYDYLVVHRANGAHAISFELTNGDPSFPSRPINDQVGTLATNSVQIIENNPVSLSRNGVYMLTASNVRDERNVSHISANVNSKLLREINLDKAVSIDFDKKYWLALNGNVYLLDYSQKDELNPFGLWFIYDNIHASCFLEKDGYLYFGSSKEGLFYRFKKDTDLLPYNDDGQPINDYWRSKYFTFGADELYKLVEKVYYSLKPNSRTSVDLHYVTNKKESDLVKSSRMDLLDFTNIDFNHFSFLVNSFPQESMAKIKAKKVTHLQLLLKNGKLDESLGVLSVGVKYQYQNPVK
jgi:hypothetical protein